jgi:hypothetical protein
MGDTDALQSFARDENETCAGRGLHGLEWKAISKKMKEYCVGIARVLDYGQ